MKNRTKINSQDIVLTEELRSSQFSIRLVLVIFVTLILVTACIKFIFKVPLPSFIFILFFVWILLYLFYYYYIQRKKYGINLPVFYFVRSLIDLFLITAAIHFLGGVEWIGAIFYLAVLSSASATLPKNKVFALSFLAVFFYLALALLECFEFLPHRTSFGPSTGLYQEPIYIFTQFLVLIIIFLFVSQNYGTLANNLKKNQGELIKAQKKIEDAKNILEVKIRARTRELRRLTGKQERIIEEKTRDLQERVNQLERIHRLSVGRELKMIELKKEIKRLEELLKSKSK